MLECGFTQVVEPVAMYGGFVLTTAALGSSPGLGPFAVCHSLSLSINLFSCQIFICSFKEKPNAQKYILKIQQMNSVEPRENTLSSHLHSWRIIHPLINEYSFSNLE